MKKERVKIKGIVNENTKGLELFQNSVLRPVIKTQHGILISHYKNYIFKRKVDFGNLTKVKRNEFIKSSLTKDISLKNQVIGIIIGHFSLEELNNYQENSSEFTKRIIQISIQRFQDSVEELI